MQRKYISPAHPSHLLQNLNRAADFIRAGEKDEHIAAVRLLHQLTHGGGTLLPHRRWLHIAELVAQGHRRHVADFHRIEPPFCAEHGGLWQVVLQLVQLQRGRHHEYPDFRALASLQFQYPGQTQISAQSAFMNFIKNDG